MNRWKKAVVASTCALGMLLSGSMISASPVVNHEVQKSDTMFDIAQKYGISLKTVIQCNPHVANSNQIWPGMILNIPDLANQIELPEYQLPVWQPGQQPSETPVDEPAPPAAQPPEQPQTPEKPDVQAPTQPAPQPTDQPAGQTTADQYAQEVVRLVNQERAKAGLSALAYNAELSAVALDKAKDMDQVGYFDHQSPTYGSPFDMMRQYGIQYSYAGENIAMGQRTPQEVMDAWMNSQGHRENIMSPNFTSIGVAYYNGKWVQMFIG